MAEPKRKMVYLAGPISSDPMGNTHRALLAADRLVNLGLVPFVPHLTVFWEIAVGPRDYERWMAYDFEVLRRCDGFVRMVGSSPGADRELAVARSLGLPCFMLDDDDRPYTDLEGWA